MKKDSAGILVAVTLAFAALVIGILIGRYTGRTPVSIHTASVQHTQTSDNTLQNSSQTKGQKININTATQEQLDTLPGIGPVLADRIVAYRDQIGAFTSLSQLTNVEGIGQERLIAIMELITLEG